MSRKVPVCLANVNEEQLRAKEKELKEQGLEVFVIRTDVTDRNQVENTVD
jgi:3-oxoacyl-[acyl-carrier protein] reductase